MTVVTYLHFQTEVCI